MPLFIAMYLFKHLCCIRHHCLYNSAAHNPLITWFSEVPILYLLGLFSFPLIFFPLCLSLKFWQPPGAFPQAERAEQQSQQRGCPQPCAQCPVVSSQVADAHFHSSAHNSPQHYHQGCGAALDAHNKTVLCFPS